MQLFIAKDGERLGPYSLEQVRDFLATGELTGQELAWHEELGDWTPLEDLLPALEQTSSTTTASGDFKYKAFISYSHQDKTWGDWLHKALETYRVPKGLIGKKTLYGEVPKRLFPVFRDREELPTATELGTVIDRALQDSGHLIVICSPRSAQSQWVNEEVKEFKRSGKADRILCLIVDGEPNAADKPDMGQEECFPEAVKYELGNDGILTSERTEPIAADAREGKDEKANALLKLVAGLLGVGFDELKQRDAARRQKRMALVAGVSVALMVVMGALSVWAMTQKKEAVKQKGIAENKQQEADKQREEAESAKEESEKQKTIAIQEKKEAEQQNYYNLIALTQLKIDVGTHSQAERMLWSTPQEYRGWEWGHFLHASQSYLMTLEGFEGKVICAAFSPDGRRIVTGGSDGTIRMWDAASGKELLTFKGRGLLGIQMGGEGRDNGGVTVELVSPGSPAQTAGLRRGDIIWAFDSKEVLTRKKLRSDIQAHPEKKVVLSIIRGERKQDVDVTIDSEATHQWVVTSIAFSPNGRRVATGSADKTAKIWDAIEGKELLALNVDLKGQTEFVSSVAFSPDGRRVATGSKLRIVGGLRGNQKHELPVKIWDATNGMELLTIKGRYGDIESVAFSPDDRRVLIVSSDGKARIWDAETGKEILTLKGLGHAVNSASFSSNGKRVVTGRNDRTAKIWDAASGTELLTLKGHGDFVLSAAFSSDGRRVVTGSADNTAKIWDAIDGTELLTLKGVETGNVVFSADGRRVMATASGGSVKLWNATLGEAPLTIEGHLNAVWFVSLSPDGRRVVTGSTDGTAKIWDIIDGTLLRTLNGHGDRVVSAVFSPDGRRVVTGSYDKTAKIWDAATGTELLTLRGHEDTVHADFSPDGRRVITGGADKTAKIWDAENGKELLTFKGHRESIVHSIFSPDGRRVLIPDFSGKATIYDAKNGRQLLTLNHGEAIYLAAFSADGRRVVTGGRSTSAKIWDAENGQELLTLKGHGKIIFSVAFSPDGRRVVTGSADNTAKIWDAVSGQEILTLSGHEDGVHSVAFSADGRKVVTGSDDGTVKIWNALDWTLSREELKEQKLERYQAWLRAQEEILADIPRVRPLAEQGDAQAQFELGKLILSNLPTQRDYQDAATWFIKAAKQGHAAAENELIRLRVSSDLKVVLAIAEGGDAEAYYTLGNRHMQGKVVEKNDKEAVAWFQKAAEQGHVQSQYKLGIMYQTGASIEKDGKEAAVWFRKAAEQGHVQSQYKLGIMYHTGASIEKDGKEAVVWLRKAGEQGHADAQNTLGVRYFNGESVPQNDQEAVKWFRKAAEQGLAMAQANLGNIHASGRSVGKGPVEAYKWYSLSANNGNIQAKSRKGTLAKKMTPDQNYKSRGTGQGVATEV